MRSIEKKFMEIIAEIPAATKLEVELSFAISNRLDFLMQKKGLSKTQLADAIGKRPNEITRWLSGEHNFTISTLAMLSTFFGEPIIEIPNT